MLEKRFAFEASHRLHHHDSKCNRLHGHSYGLVIEVGADELVADGPKRGMVVDFDDIAAHVRPMIADHLDHHHLNDTLGTDSPTAEFIAVWCYKYLRPLLPLLTAVTVEETPSARVTYRPRQAAAATTTPSPQ